MRIAKIRCLWPMGWCLSVAPPLWAQDQVPLESIDSLSAAVSSREFRTTAIVAGHLAGLYISLGGKPPGTPEEQVAAHHTPDFHIDESGFDVGVRAMAAMAWQYMVSHQEE